MLLSQLTLTEEQQKEFDEEAAALAQRQEMEQEEWTAARGIDTNQLSSVDEAIRVSQDTSNKMSNEILNEFLFMPATIRPNSDYDYQPNNEKRNEGVEPI